MKTLTKLSRRGRLSRVGNNEQQRNSDAQLVKSLEKDLTTAEKKKDTILEEKD